MAEKKKITHIAIAGNIGAGKTTLTNLLAKNFNWDPQFEDVENNPYLNDFYDDMPKPLAGNKQFANLFPLTQLPVLSRKE